MNYEKEISQIEEINSRINGNRGIEVARSICHYLKLGRWTEALAIRQNDGDKLYSYPELNNLIIQIFGCRAHAKKDCTSWICSRLSRA